MRRIWLIRHAKSADPLPGQSDFDRPLKPRGARNGQAMQAWLGQQHNAPSWIWTSPACRAASTAQYITDATQATCVAEPTLYLASAQTILDVLRSTPESLEGHPTQNAAVVAHNPGLTHCLNLLVGEFVTDNMVTLAAAELEVANNWSDVAFGTARLIQHITPADLNNGD